LRHGSRRLVLSGLLTLSALAAMLVIPATTFAASTVSTTAATVSSCGEERWPASVQGQPATFFAGARAGDYIWHNATGWHLRFTHPGTARVVFSGTIVSNAALTVAPYRLEAGDTFALSADKKTLTYRFLNHGRIDGLDVRTACATRLWFRGSMAGVKLPTGRIWLGHAGRHPLQNPFVILRNR
jgi:ABC-type transport system substrate-binding protein